MVHSNCGDFFVPSVPFFQALSVGVKQKYSVISVEQTDVYNIFVRDNPCLVHPSLNPQPSIKGD